MNYKFICILGIPLVPISIFILIVLKLIFKKSFYIFVISNKYFGHIAFDTEIRLHEAKGRHIIAAFREVKSVNTALEEMIRDLVCVYPRIFVIPLEFILRRLPSAFANWIGYSNWGKAREIGRSFILGDKKRYLKLTSNQIALEESVLRQFGLKRKSYFCIAIRDGFYHSGKPGQNEESYRNLDFSLFIPMIQCESFNSINFVRMGRASKNYFEAKNFFDYSFSKDASDLADLILLKNSLGLINSGDGIGSVAEVLDIPVFFISHAPWEILNTFSQNNMIVPALFFDEKSDALAKANRIFDYEKIPMSKSSYWSRGLKLLPPSSEEIKIYCREFISWVSAEVKEEIELDERCFWEKFYKELPEYAKPYHINIKARVPRYFVDKYSKILFS